MAQQGWICVHRKITKCELWLSSEPFSVRDAWIDLLLMANHEKNTVVMGTKIIEVNPGERVTSQGHLAERWHWGRQKVRDYLNLLQKLGMITIKSTNKYTIIKVLKYEVYQGLDGEKEPTNNQQITNKKPTNNHQITTNNNDNNDNNENNNIPVVVVSNNPGSKGGTKNDYNPIQDLTNKLGWMPTAFQAQMFLALFEEVGQYAYEKALTRAAGKKIASYNYIRDAARGIAAGDDFDDRPKGGGGGNYDGHSFDIKKALQIADELERERKHA